MDVTAYTKAYYDATTPTLPLYPLDWSKLPTSLESVEVMRLTSRSSAVSFFGTVLDRNTNDGLHFTRYLVPKFLLHHEGDIYSAESFAGWGDICPRCRGRRVCERLGDAPGAAARKSQGDTHTCLRRSASHF